MNYQKCPKKNSLSKYEIERIPKVYGKSKIKIFKDNRLTIKAKPVK